MSVPLTRLRDVRMARHDRRVLDPGPLGMTFLRPPGAVSRTRYVHRHAATTVILRPRLRVAVAVASRAAAPPAQLAGPAPRSVVRCRVVERAERLVERVHVFERPGPPAVAPASAAPPTAVVARARALQAWGGPVPTVVARRAAPAEAAPDPAPGAAGAPGGAAEGTGVMTALVPPGREARHAAPPVQADVGELTEQVIAAIDRRLVARRERLGRA